MQRLWHRFSIWPEQECHPVCPRRVRHLCDADGQLFVEIVAIVYAYRILPVSRDRRIREQSHLAPCSCQGPCLRTSHSIVPRSPALSPPPRRRVQIYHRYSNIVFKCMLGWFGTRMVYFCVVHGSSLPVGCFRSQASSSIDGINSIPHNVIRYMEAYIQHSIRNCPYQRTNLTNKLTIEDHASYRTNSVTRIHTITALIILFFWVIYLQLHNCVFDHAPVPQMALGFFNFIHMQDWAKMDMSCSQHYRITFSYRIRTNLCIRVRQKRSERH